MLKVLHFYQEKIHVSNSCPTYRRFIHWTRYFAL